MSLLDMVMEPMQSGNPKVGDMRNKLWMTRQKAQLIGEWGFAATERQNEGEVSAGAALS